MAASYTIKYNDNGGSGAPSSQTKKHGVTLTLSKITPKRTGYTFVGWGTSSSDKTANWSPGGSYTANASDTLYAIWKKTITLTFHANGGSDTPHPHSAVVYNADKTATFILPSAVPTRQNYKFLGWSKSSTSESAAYTTGGAISLSSNLTLYAVWMMAPTAPSVYGLRATRCDSSRIASDNGTCAVIEFSWASKYAIDHATIDWGTGEHITISGSTNMPTGAGYTSRLIGTGTPLSTELTYRITVTVYDENDLRGSATTYLYGAKYPIDACRDPDTGDVGVAFGKPAEKPGVAEFALSTEFNKPVSGKALGMDRVPEIPAGSELNDYIEPGCYAIYRDDTAGTITYGGTLLGTTGGPGAKAGRLEVWSSTGEGVRAKQWSYLRQRYIPFSSSYSTWEREIRRDANNLWHYYDWWRTSLTPTAADKVYHEQKVLWGDDRTEGLYMTDTHTATLSEPISSQPHGIVLVFSLYISSEETDRGWQCFFVPKTLVKLTEASGVADTYTFELCRTKFVDKATKYLYIYDNYITGHSGNKDSGTSNGIEFDNSKFVLRYVIGV